MNGSAIYYESVSSKKTTRLFVVLAAVFFIFAVWRSAVRDFDTLAGVLLFFSGFFLFYVINFRTLVIQLSPEALRLDFGIFHWTIPVSNIANCQHDEDLPWLMKNGGAGIHFMFIRNRYRASFNFLEHPSLVVALKEKAGPVADISFTTRNPDELIRQIVEAITA